MFLTSPVPQRKACFGGQQLQKAGIHQTHFRLWRCKQAFTWSTRKSIYETRGGQSGEVFGNKLQRSSAAVPVQKSPYEGFGKDRSQLCCAFRHPDEWKAVLDAWKSMLTDVLWCNVNLLCWGHVSRQAAQRTTLLPQVLVGFSHCNGISLAAECHLQCWCSGQQTVKQDLSPSTSMALGGESAGAAGAVVVLSHGRGAGQSTTLEWIIPPFMCLFSSARSCICVLLWESN